MQYDGSIVFHAEKEPLFDLLTDGASLAPCVPGMKSFEVVEPGKSFRIIAQAKFGMLEPEMNLLVTFTLLERPDCARLRIRGRGASSHVGASSYITLQDHPEGSEMHWSFTFSVFGQLANIGHRLMHQAFDRMHQDFIDGVRALVRERLG